MPNKCQSSNVKQYNCASVSICHWDLGFHLTFVIGILSLVFNTYVF